MGEGDCVSDEWARGREDWWWIPQHLSIKGLRGRATEAERLRLRVPVLVHQACGARQGANEA